MKVGRRYLEKNAHPISPVLGWFQTTVVLNNDACDTSMNE